MAIRGKLLQPVLLCIFSEYFTSSAFLHQVKEIFRSYFDTGAVDRINFETEVVEGLKTCKCFRNRAFKYD